MNDANNNNTDSPLMLGEIKTGTPIDLTIDHSLNNQTIQNIDQLNSPNSPNSPNSQSQQSELRVNNENNENNQNQEHETILNDIMMMNPQQEKSINKVDNDMDIDKEDEETSIQQHNLNSDLDPDSSLIYNIQNQSNMILPDLFSLLYDIQNGLKSAKDFDKYLSSSRLKLSNSKNYLTQLDFININNNYKDSSLNRNEILKTNNVNKIQFLKSFKQKIESEF
ncbi:unnamed protein product [Candida verbasci]|uniref:Mediator of RNA polymerase II transcription subunit 9 n=1 Tax=Candida verbasci TaxID=1227364 RepID=A0A9W4U1F1_9ASCO|nr:unnamed protein product [Candida verbasci]